MVRIGTRSTTKIYEIWMDEKGKKHKSFILGLYKQYDGYTDGWGETLKNFIESGVFVNGINSSKQGSKKFMFNGIGCFALQLVCNFKNGAGDLYATSENDFQEYNYVVEYEYPYQTIKEKVVERLTGYGGNKVQLRLICKEKPNFNKDWILEVD